MSSQLKTQGGIMQQAGTWLSILDYAKLKNISISTIRRHIKANKVVYKSDGGKYLIFVDRNDQAIADHSEEIRVRVEIETLRTRLRELEEENNDLKMLVTLYENGQMLATKKTTEPPTVPLI